MLIFGVLVRNHRIGTSNRPELWRPQFGSVAPVWKCGPSFQWTQFKRGAAGPDAASELKMGRARKANPVQPLWLRVSPD